MYALVENVNNRIAALSNDTPVFEDGVWTADGVRYGWLNSDASARAQTAPGGAKINDFLTVGGVLTPALLPPPVPTPPPPTFYQWYLDLGSYYDRFGTAKLLVLSSADAIVKAAISDASIRNYIDLERPEVQAVVMYMSGATVPGLGTIAAPLINSAQASDILTTVPDSSEQLKTIAYLKSVGLL
jgi:hypothetical protein